MHQRLQVAGGFEHELQSFTLGVDTHHRGDLLEQGRQGNLGKMQLETAGPDARQVEQIVDQIEQVAAAARYCSQRLPAIRVGQRPLAHELSVSEDCVQRRAQLVAHVGEELILGAARGFFLRARRHESPPLGAEQADIKHARHDDGGENRQRRPDCTVVDLAFIAHR